MNDLNKKINWEEYFSKQIERKKFIEFGRLGGRPKKFEPKTERLHIRISARSKGKLQEKADILGISLIEYCRRVIENRPIPDVSKSKILIEYRTNFSRIANHFRSEMWSESERKVYLELLREVISNINKSLDI